MHARFVILSRLSINLWHIRFYTLIQCVNFKYQTVNITDQPFLIHQQLLVISKFLCINLLYFILEFVIHICYEVNSVDRFSIERALMLAFYHFSSTLNAEIMVTCGEFAWLYHDVETYSAINIIKWIFFINYFSQDLLRFLQNFFLFSFLQPIFIRCLL